MVNVSLRHTFSVFKGWDNAGLFQFPWPRPEDDAMPSFELFEGGFANDFATARCRRYGISTWTFVGANIDQGFFAYVFNISGHGSFRPLMGRNKTIRYAHPRCHFQGN